MMKPLNPCLHYLLLSMISAPNFLTTMGHREEAAKVYKVPYDSSLGLSLTCFGLGMNQRFTFGTANDVLHDNESFVQVFEVCSQNCHCNPDRR